MSRFALAILALAVGQSLFLGAMIGDRISLLRSPVVVTLETRPIDPRDIFRGDYVILSYAITTLATGDLDGDDEFQRGDAIYVELETDGKISRPVAIWRNMPEQTTGNAVIRGTVSYVASNMPVADLPGSEAAPSPQGCPGCGEITVNYGIESYFVPEGEGRELENRRDAGQLTIDVALGSDGTPAIKQLRLDGKPVYTEPLF